MCSLNVKKACGYMLFLILNSAAAAAMRFVSRDYDSPFKFFFLVFFFSILHNGITYTNGC
jgi:hypothetical protein